MTPADLLCLCINNFSDGEGHPEATPENLQFFKWPYAWECVKRALASNKITENGKEQIRVLTRERIRGLCSPDL